ncbi:thiol reductant ABC exporter subunit CydD [Conexibacter woesei]|uniref:ABC transporter, CydDC cysteine exporter (CydDC-E) family, permease/ATP-binding protein CydD n=1 Tax=Conexibacter woesei (strain DSM 14684 / CCUG 47730 / CIP 108061 / JCM 11494 / NBRC 100937 / ID131577) TaxID=469383 RepID=D3FD51_CONWI|nr:thiol reductant ABC exporter subunit CydD [Conexibacter woesei]ADB53443.1 ABC transporter, CydDC cysteine exporter (CydDC- E) family, permease/ATP-binding protein CydD [Conexibacter woesei DSM 14684]
MTPREVHRRLLGLAGGTRVLLGGAVAAGLAGAVLLVVQALALARIVDGAAFGGKDLAALRPLVVTLALALAGRALLATLTEWLGRRAAEHAMGALRHRVAAHVLAARTPRVEDARRGELATAAVHGVDALAEYYAKAVPQIALAAAVPVGLVGVILWHDPLVGALLAVTLPLVVVFMVLVGRESAERIDERRLALGVLGSHFLDVVRGLPTLRAHGRAEAQAETLGAIGERYRSESVAALRVAFLSALVLELMAMVGTAIAAAVVGVQLAGGSLGFEAGLLVLLLAPEVYVPLRLAGQRYHAAEDGAAAAQTLLELLDEPVGGRSGDLTTVGVVNPPLLDPPDPARAPLTLRGVRVDGGAGRPPALDGLDLTLTPGRLTALVGASGAGKSTLLRLLARLAEPDEGAVLCGATDLRAVASEAWWPRIAWLPQRAALLRGPLEEMLRLQCPDAPGDALALALRRADADAIVAALPAGLATPVGAGGRGFSGGQAQRLALAGALLSTAPLLLLDEPTAHLDPASATMVAAGIRAAAAGRTAIVSTHDPALVAVCDEVVALEAGRVAELLEGAAA